MKKILVIEDDRAVSIELQVLLKNAGYETVEIHNFKNILEQIISIHPDLILLDINLPEVNGEILLRELRKEEDIPVIIVTSRTAEIDEVISMSYGADDYITKPYNPTILLLRIAAVLKRMEGKENTTFYKDLKVNPAKGTLSKGNEELFLTKNEMIIFQHLLDKRNQIVSRDELVTNLWDNNEFVNESDFGYPDAIETRKKQGYLLI